MTFSSTQISQLIGGQQAAYANQAAFARQIGASAGIAQPPGAFAGGFHAPSYGVQGYGGQDIGIAGMSLNSNVSAGGYGAAAVGGMGAALPAAAAGMSLAGGLGLMGSAGRVLDPFTVGMRAFAGGAGAAGLAGGIGAAALATAPHMAAYYGLQTVGQNIYAGAQNISQVGGMMQQYMGPSYGEAGARPGGQHARGQIQAITSVLGEIASQETMADMASLRRVMDQAGQFGMLTGIQNVGQFKDKFRRVFSQAKDIAQVLGSSIEEAVPVLNSFQKMGMWSTQDIMGGALSMKTVGGAAAPHLIQSMQLGAMRSHAMGGSLAAGANLGRSQFMNIQAATQSGVLSNEMIQEFTGGVGGVEGQQMVADRLTGAIQSMSQTPLGRLAMAGLAETRDGQFTGRIDQGKLKKFNAGQLSIQKLQEMGMSNTRTREGAASFTYRQEQLGQELMAQGGLEFAGAGFQSALDKAGFGAASEDIQGLMLQKMYGLNRRDSHMIQKLLKEMPTIKDRRQRRELAALEDAFRQVEERQNRSFAGFSDAVKGAFEESIERPLQAIGEQLATSWNERIDSLTDKFWGRRRQLQISREERLRMLYSGGTQGVTQQNISSLMSGDIAATFGDTSVSERIRNQGLFMGIAGAIGGGVAGTRAADLIHQGARLTQEGQAGPGGISVGSDGGGVDYAISRDEASRTLEGMRRRGGYLTADRVFKSGEKAREQLSTVQRAYSTVLSTPANREKLRKMRETMTPAEYSRALVKMVRQQNPDAGRALDELQKSRGDNEGQLGSDLDALAVVQKGEGWRSNNLEADFASIAKEAGPNLASIFQDSAELAKFTEAGVAEAFSALEGQRAGSATTMLSARNEFLGIGGKGGRDLGGLSETQLQTILSEGGAVGEELAEWAASGDASVDPSKYPSLYKAAMSKGSEYDPRIDKIVNTVGGQMSAADRQRFAKGAQQVQLAKKVKVSAQHIEHMGTLAGEELTRMKGAGAPEVLTKVLGQFVEAGASRDLDRFRAAERQAQEVAKNLDQSAIDKLRHLGGPIAEHIADLAEIGKLDIAGMGGQEVRHRLRRSGLADEFALLQSADPEKHAELESMLKSGKVTETGARRFREALKKVEERTGATESTTAGERSQDKLMTNLTQFVGANEKFVLAVSAAVPKLEHVSVDDLRKKMSQLSENEATGGGTSGKR